MDYRGSCHCGKVKVDFKGEFGAAISCNCSICVTGEDQLITYTFNKHAIQHRFCKTCGIQVFGEAVSPQGVPTMAINIRCLEDFDFTQVPLQAWDGKSQ
ncbi:MAG: hypothetical protein K0Q92_2964 [Steroidobacteraceae bacterium]|nr:hypothetical protein [Steroidobacteraceae bacterium]